MEGKAVCMEWDGGAWCMDSRHRVGPRRAKMVEAAVLPDSCGVRVGERITGAVACSRAGETRSNRGLKNCCVGVREKGKFFLREWGRWEL